MIVVIDTASVPSGNAAVVGPLVDVPFPTVGILDIGDPVRCSHLALWLQLATYLVVGTEGLKE